MSDLSAYIWIAGGVFVGVVYPVLLGIVRKQFPTTTAGGMPAWMKRYGILFVFCLITALIVLAIYKNGNPGVQLDWVKAFLLGFGWESIVEKSLKPPAPGGGARPPTGS